MPAYRFFAYSDCCLTASFRVPHGPCNCSVSSPQYHPGPNHQPSPSSPLGSVSIQNIVGLIPNILSHPSRYFSVLTPELNGSLDKYFIYLFLSSSTFSPDKFPFVEPDSHTRSGTSTPRPSMVHALFFAEVVTPVNEMILRSDSVLHFWYLSVSTE
jgi:hypothetical protein